MRFLAIIVALYFFPACSRSDAGETPNIGDLKAHRDSICRDFDPQTITRCDRSTFHVLMAWGCNKTLPTQYEYPSGKWNRDVRPCWPDYSRSQTSLDTYLGVILSGDEQAKKRVIDYAKPRGWETGEPEGGVGNITPLIPLLGVYLQAGPGEPQGLIDGHRGHLTALWLWVWAQQNEGLTFAGSRVLREIAKKTPESPLFSCLSKRFSGDKDQRRTVELWKKQGTKTFGWGSAPWELFPVLTYKCLKGD